MKPRVQIVQVGLGNFVAARALILLPKSIAHLNHSNVVFCSNALFLHHFLTLLSRKIKSAVHARNLELRGLEKMMNTAKILSAAVIAVTVAVSAPASAQSETVNIYSYRQPYLIEPLLEKFESETGIRPIILFANNGLIERAAAEGENSPVDVILTTDIGNLAAAKAADITQPITLDTVTTRVPAAFRDPDGAWTGLSLRARVFYVSKDRVSQEALSYSDIAKPEWKGRVCTRSGQHVYNIGLVASYIADNGLETTRDWLTGVRDNLVTNPTGNDRAQVKSIFSGACDLAIGNTYYMGLMSNNTDEPEQQEWANSVRIIFPDAENGGTHVNVSGAILAKHAPHKTNAEKLIAFLVSKEGQELYALGNYEYPVVEGVEASETVRGWGALVRDETPLSDIASFRGDASALVDELRFDDGPQN